MNHKELLTIDSADLPVPHHETIRVLVAEDDGMYRRILESWLKEWGFCTMFAKDGEQAWEILQQEPTPQLLIVDWVMPRVDGIELCRRIRQKQQERYQYVLLVTGKEEKRNVVQGLEAGADDYLTKPFDRNELRARIKVGKRILSLQHDLIRAREELLFRATHDALLGIWNRGALLDAFRRELERAARSQSPTAVLMIDVDHFKKVNDSRGHLTGDLVLREIVDRMQKAVRPYDLVGRYGGEEFLIVLPGCDRNQARESAERIRLAVVNEPVLANGSEFPVTISIGVAVTAPGDTSESEVLASADTAMYRAKSAGRNCTVTP
jgi:two-component system cell cycle response regulator